MGTFEKSGSGKFVCAFVIKMLLNTIIKRIILGALFIFSYVKLQLEKLTNAIYVKTKTKQKIIRINFFNFMIDKSKPTF